MSFFITIKIIIVLLLFQATLISRSVSQEINDAADPHPGKSLELSLELSEKEARLGDYLYARVTIKNIGDKPVDAPLDIHRKPSHLYYLNSKYVNEYSKNPQRGVEVFSYNIFIDSTRSVLYKPLNPGESRVIDMTQLLFGYASDSVFRKGPHDPKKLWALTTEDDDAKIVIAVHVHFYNPDGSVRLKKKYYDAEWAVSRRGDGVPERINPDHPALELTASAKVKVLPRIEVFTKEERMKMGYQSFSREDSPWYDKLTPGPEKRYWRNFQLLRKAFEEKDEEKSRKYFKEWGDFLAGLPEIERNYLAMDYEGGFDLPYVEQTELYKYTEYRKNKSPNISVDYWRSRTLDFEFDGDLEAAEKRREKKSRDREEQRKREQRAKETVEI